MTDVHTRPKHDAPVKAEFYVKPQRACWIFHKWQWQPLRSQDEQWAKCAACGAMKKKTIW